MMINQLSKDDVEQKVMGIIADKVTAHAEQLELYTPLHQLGIDSLDLVEIVLEIEDSFACHIDDEKIEQLETISEITDYVYSITKK